MKGVVHLRLSGDLADLVKVLTELVASTAFQISVDEHKYPNRDGSVRVYADLVEGRTSYEYH